MTIRHLAGAVAAVLVTGGISVIAPATSRAQSAFVLPDKGDVTLTGCFQRVLLRGDDEKYVLAKPTTDTVASVPTGGCTYTDGDQVVRLEHVKQMADSMLGQWIEVSGRLESTHHPEKTRELHVKSFRVIPIVIEKKVTEVIQVPVPVAQAPVTPTMPYTPPPVATTGEVRQALPKTATSLPLVGLIGLLSLASGLALRFFGRTGRA
jgi:hypothetical protein